MGAFRSSSRPRRARHRPRRPAVAGAVALALALGTGGVARASTTSHAINFQTPSHDVFCGIAMHVRGTVFDPGVQAPLNGFYPGLQCSAKGIPRPKGQPNVGDPFVHLGQGRAGRAQDVLESQDDLVSSADPVTLAAGSHWQRDHIDCTLTRTTVSCDNGHGHGFTVGPGALKLY
jgi:hypothetical protein